MTRHSEDYEKIRSYLLGTLSDEDRQLIEERLLTESDFLEELQVREEELIDDYVNDDLAADSRLRYEQHFLCTPDRLQKHRFAIAFDRYAKQIPHPVPVNSRGWFKAFWGGQTPAFRFATAAVLIATVSVTVWLIRRPIFPPTTSATANIFISYGDRADGSTATRIKLPLNVDAQKFVLRLPDSSIPVRGFRVEWINDQLVPRPLAIADEDAESLTVVIPTKQLTRGQHTIHLYATNSDGREQRINGDYFFTVE